MKIEIKLSEFEAMALKREAEHHSVSLADMALAYMRDGLRIENAQMVSRRRYQRENVLKFTPLQDYDPHPNPRY